MWIDLIFWSPDVWFVDVVEFDILLLFLFCFSIHRLERGKGKPGPFGGSAKDLYSGWTCMKTLITKGLVVKSSCPAKYDYHTFFVFFL